MLFQCRTKYAGLLQNRTVICQKMKLTFKSKMERRAWIEALNQQRGLAPVRTVGPTEGEPQDRQDLSHVQIGSSDPNYRPYYCKHARASTADDEQ